MSNSDLFDFAVVENGTPVPNMEDGINAVGWRLFATGPFGDFLADAYILDDGVNIIETDIVYNLKHKWAINSAIEPGSTECGTQFDVQAIVTHEIGHMLGLGHPENVDATMYASAAKEELKKQTLTTGDVTGANVVAPI